MKLTPEQRKIATLIVRQGQKMGASRKQIKSAISTALVEADLGNPAGGHGTSVGWRQEIADYGSVAKRRNVRGAAKRYFTEARQHDKGGIPSWELAARVQRPAAAYRGRYKDEAPQAEAVLALFGLGKKTGKGGTTPQPGTPDRLERTPVTLGRTSTKLEQLEMVQQMLSGRIKPIEMALGVRDLQAQEQDITANQVRYIEGRPASPRRGTGSRTTTKAKLRTGGGYSGMERLARHGRFQAHKQGWRHTDKRERKYTASGNISDHWVGNKRAWAEDYSNGSQTANDAGRRLARRIAKRYGVKFIENSYASGGTIKVGGKKVRVQLLYGDKIAHGDHVHVGYSVVG